MEDVDTRSLLLHPFPLLDQKIKLCSYAGGGRAGHVLKVRIGTLEDNFALKMFKFDNPEINVSRLKGSKRRAFHDPFFIECRANGSLILQGLNGRVTPYCYGWLEVPSAIEMQVARRFDLHPLLWERPAARCAERVRGILFKWVDGEVLSRIPMSLDVVNQARARVEALHNAGIVHGDLAASNLLVEGHGQNQQVHLLDLSASITLPHVKFSVQELVRIKQQEIKYLDIGFTLLSRLPINKGLRVSDMPFLHDTDWDSTEHRFIKHLWAPPQPRCWQEKPDHSSLCFR